MKTKTITSMFLTAALLAFGIGAAAQHSSEDQSQHDRTAQDESKPSMTGGGMMGGGMMGQMATHHQQMSTLMSKLMDSMSAIQNEKDPTALKSKLAKHQTLLNQMRSQMMGQGKMMQMMSGEMKQSCQGSDDAVKPPAK